MIQVKMTGHKKKIAKDFTHVILIKYVTLSGCIIEPDYSFKVGKQENWWSTREWSQMWAAEGGKYDLLKEKRKTKGRAGEAQTADLHKAGKGTKPK